MTSVICSSHNESITARLPESVHVVHATFATHCLAVGSLSRSPVNGRQGLCVRGGEIDFCSLPLVPTPTKHSDFLTHGLTSRAVMLCV